MWLQFYPKTLFDLINYSGSGVISKRELDLFFTAFYNFGNLGEDNGVVGVIRIFKEFF